MSIELLYWARSICLTISMLSVMGLICLAVIWCLAYGMGASFGAKPSPNKKFVIAFVVLVLIFVLTPPRKTFDILIEQAKQGACTTSTHKIEVEE